jgi:hypothetical protein
MTKRPAFTRISVIPQEFVKVSALGAFWAIARELT